ncbi:MAG: metalloregulator ArsR/SmtB family transcription factor [Gemmatimonadota bacterium]|jgi:DNA-binding transcriptional ArsR family regulator
MTYAKALDALAEPTRRRLLDLLRERPRSVGEMADRVPVSQPAVSQHLAVLRDAGLVESTRDGTRRIYSLRPDGLGPLRRYVESFWDAALEAYGRSFEEPGGGGGASSAEPEDTNHSTEE